MKRRNTSKEMAELHSRATQRLKERRDKADNLTAETDIHRLYHDLQVHEIELEMQNEELRRTQEDLEQSKSQYESLYEFSPVGYLTFDRKGLIEAINLPGAVMLGLERKRLMKASFSRVLQPDSVVTFLSHIETVFRTGTKQTCELSLNVQGRRLHAAMESVRVNSDGGAPVHCHSAITDITERKEAEIVQGRLAAIVDSAEDAVISKSLNGIIQTWNAGAENIFGYKAEEVIGKPISLLIPPGHTNEVPKILARIKRGEHIENFETLRQRKDGTIVFVSLTFSPIKDASGRIIGASKIAHDIGARKQAERYQHLAAEVLNVLNDPSTLDNAINLILTAIVRETGFDAVGMRLQSGDDFPYFVQNGFAPDFLLTENTLIARNASSGPCRDENNNISLECTCGLVISGKTDPTSPFFTDGGTFWTNNSLPLLDLPAEQDPRLHPRNNCIHQGYLSVALIPIRANQEIVGLLHLNDRRKDRFNATMIRLLEGIAASIGIALMRKETERLLEEHTVKLENAYKELESFSYSVSHDLRAPLRAIDGYARMILKAKGDQFDEQTRQQFNVIRDNTQAMNQLINDILAFSRAGRQELVVSRIDMSELVKEIWETLRTINPDKKCHLQMDQLPPGTGDKPLIRQVLTNLLSNAIKYSGNREVSLVEVGGQANGNENIYYVKDNGAGFDMAYYHKLFGVFQRLHSLAEFEGTGVGLAIVQRIIQRHGGRVWAEAEKDKGATFFIALPTRQEKRSLSKKLPTTVF